MTGTGTPLVQITGVTKSFDAVRALRGVDLRIDKAEVTALLGDNGAGKSTLVRCLTGVHPPDSGEIRFRGEPIRLTFLLGGALVLVGVWVGAIGAQSVPSAASSVTEAGSSVALAPMRELDPRTTWNPKRSIRGAIKSPSRLALIKPAPGRCGANFCKTCAINRRRLCQRAPT